MKLSIPSLVILKRGGFAFQACKPRNKLAVENGKGSDLRIRPQAKDKIRPNTKKDWLS